MAKSPERKAYCSKMLTPIAARRYTVQEIDVMREAIMVLKGASLTVAASGQRRWYFPDVVWESFARTCEDELRTAMMGGVTPEELLAAVAQKHEETKRKWC